MQSMFMVFRQIVCVAMTISHEINIIIYHNINEKDLQTQY